MQLTDDGIDDTGGNRMKWYNLRNEKGMEIRVDSAIKAMDCQDNGYKMMSVIDLTSTSKCKEG